MFNLSRDPGSEFRMSDPSNTASGEASSSTGRVLMPATSKGERNDLNGWRPSVDPRSQATHRALQRHISLVASLPAWTRRRIFLRKKRWKRLYMTSSSILTMTTKMRGEQRVSSMLKWELTIVQGRRVQGRRVPPPSTIGRRRRRGVRKRSRQTPLGMRNAREERVCCNCGLRQMKSRTGRSRMPCLFSRCTYTVRPWDCTHIIKDNLSTRNENIRLYESRRPIGVVHR